MMSSSTPTIPAPSVLTTFHFLRQQMDKPPGQFNHCLADYVAPKADRNHQLATLNTSRPTTWALSP